MIQQTRNKKRWYKFTVSIPSSHQDLLIGQLAFVGFQGFLQEPERLECFLPANKSIVSIKKSLRSILLRFHSEFPQLSLPFTTATIQEQNWNKRWEANTGIVEVTPNIIVKPSWKKLSKRRKKKLVLHIDPKMSFGTGHHETTRLSLILLERYLEPNMQVLDFGCGTGILGIASAKMGAKKVTLIDNDHWAILNTKENIRRNHVEKKATIVFGQISKIEKKKYDLIVTNIDVPTITKYFTSLLRYIRKGGAMIFSGILVADSYSMSSLFTKHKVKIVEIKSENEWIAFVLIKE